MGTLGAVWFSLDGLAAIPLLVAVGWAALATQVLPRWFANFSRVVVVLALVMRVVFVRLPPATRPV